MNVIMSEHGKVTLTLHGLQADNGLVRADAFLEKFRTLLESLKTADKFANGKKVHNYIVTGLKISSAQAQLSEKISVRKAAPVSSVELVRDTVNAVYNGEKKVDRFSVELIEALFPLVKNVGKNFSHGEISFDASNVIRIDDYLAKQFDKMTARLKGDDIPAARNFEGIAIGMFDGIIQEMDARGSLVRGKIILTAGGREIDCVFRRDDIETLRASFDKHARIEAIAHYDGISLLPVRLDVRGIKVVKTNPDLIKWKGKLKRNTQKSEWS